MMKTRRRKPLECVGGPLCGAKFPSHERFVYVDDQDCPHYYKKVRLSTDDNSAVAVYHCYFGTDVNRAIQSPPMLRPPERLFRPKT